MNDDSSLNEGIWTGLDEISIISRGEEEDDDESPRSRRVFWGSTARTLLPQFETADFNEEQKKSEEERMITPTNKEITHGQENPTKRRGKKRKRRKARNKARNKAKSKVSTPITAG
tara:strand:- start:3632 stop:3979 length:348 start_codon:yes stop_codon:yes gene_type:complete